MKKYFVPRPVLRTSSPALTNYLTAQILPRYAKLDCGHNSNHIHQVLINAYQLGDKLEIRGVDINYDIVTTSVVYHDLGVLAPTKEGRKYHHLLSAEEVLADSHLPDFFSSADINLIATIAREHRASGSLQRIHLLSQLVADADTIDSANIERICAYTQDWAKGKSLKEKITIMFDHFTDKHGKNTGYASVDLPEAEEMWRADRALLQDLLTDKRKFFDFIVKNYGEYFRE